MTSNKTECGRIDFNIRNLTNEFHSVVDSLSDIQSQGERLNGRLLDLQSERSSIVASSAIPARGAVDGPVGVGLTVVDAIAKARQLSRIDFEIALVTSERDNLRNEWRRLDGQRSNKLELIRQSQADFNVLDCFELGFSHDVLDMP